MRAIIRVRIRSSVEAEPVSIASETSSDNRRNRKERLVCDMVNPATARLMNGSAPVARAMRAATAINGRPETTVIRSRRPTWSH